MGLDIGYTLYEKEPFNKEGKFVRAKDDSYDRWACGRCEVNNSWGDLFKFDREKTTVPVFQKELDGKIQQLEEYRDEYKLYTYDEFKDYVLEAVQKVYEDSVKVKKDICHRIKKNKDSIKELRDLQKSCTEDEQYAFEKWGEEIDRLKEDIEEDENYYDTFDDEDYDFTHAKRIEELVRKMGEDLEEDKYYIIPYFSY